MANTYTFSIGGSNREVVIQGLSMSEAANAIDTLKCDVRSLDGSYRPAIDDQILVSENGTRIFGGRLEEVTEAGLNDQGNTTGLRFRLSAKSFGQFADWQIVTLTLAAGTLKSQLTTLVAELSSYGTALHGSQADGPTMPKVDCTERKLSDVLNDLASISGYVWRIDENNKLRMWAKGDIAASFDVVNADGHAIGDIIVESTRNDLFTNSVVLVVTGAGPQTSAEDFTATGGSTDAFETAYPASQNINDAWPNQLIVNGTVIGPVGWGSGTAPWSWDYATHTLENDGSGYVPTVGDTVRVTYAIGYPFTVTSEDSFSIAAIGERKRKFTKDEALTIEAAQALADGLLAAQSTTVRKINYQTTQTGVKPGYSQTITVTKRNVNASLLVQEVTSTWLTSGVLLRAVSGTLSDVFQGTFRGTYEQWNGNSSGGGGSVEVTGGVQQSRGTFDDLRLVGPMIISGRHTFSLSGPSTISAGGVDDFVLDITSAAFSPSVAAITGLVDNQLCVLRNSSGTDFNVLHNSGLVGAGKILCPNDTDWPFKKDSVAWVQYDPNAASGAGRVRLFGTMPTMATSNLSDVATGTWTPTVDFGGGTTGITYGTQTGYYKKLSATAYLVAATIVLTSKGSSTGSMHVTASPSGNCVMSMVFDLWMDNMTTATTPLSGSAAQISGGTTINVYKDGVNGATALTDADCTNTSRFLLTGIVFV